ncbi:ATP-binding protein [Streptomyces sp. NPDC050844]|uniref:ATP-binding protein n=1 Tax=Streptomyces sp. NPDC050844 TaxID=3155790 RepID=UPI0033E0D340
MSGVVAQLVAELAANAVQHGHVRGRDFRLRLTAGVERTLRIEVTDACVDRLPCMPSGEDSALGEAESGRGLLIVDTLAHRWGCDTSDSASKTVWAEIALA